MRRTVEEWRAISAAATMDFLDQEGAFIPGELEAKLSDSRWSDWPTINPHHLTSARVGLLDSGAIVTKSERTRGGAWIATYTRQAPTKEALRRAGRKRLLQARYLGWTRVSSDWDPAPIPAALERVLHRSLVDAAPHGYRLAQPDGGEVRKLFGSRIPGGSIDNVAHYSSMDASGLPGPVTTVLIEAKNVRQWIYPRTQELYQLLDKACSLQLNHPALRFAPVLVCRRINPISGAMAKQVGFHLIETKTQYVRSVVTADEEAMRKFNEVNSELGYNLTAHEGPVVPMTRQFTQTIPARLDEIAERWALFAKHPDVPDLLAKMRDDEITNQDRHETLAAIASAVVDVTAEDVQWANPERF